MVQAGNTTCLPDPWPRFRTGSENDSRHSFVCLTNTTSVVLRCRGPLVITHLRIFSKWSGALCTRLLSIFSFSFLTFFLSRHPSFSFLSPYFSVMQQTRNFLLAFTCSLASERVLVNWRQQTSGKRIIGKTYLLLPEGMYTCVCMLACVRVVSLVAVSYIRLQKLKPDYHITTSRSQSGVSETLVWPPRLQEALQRQVPEQTLRSVERRVLARCVNKACTAAVNNVCWHARCLVAFTWPQVGSHYYERSQTCASVHLRIFVYSQDTSGFLSIPTPIFFIV